MPNTQIMSYKGTGVNNDSATTLTPTIVHTTPTFTDITPSNTTATTPFTLPKPVKTALLILRCLQFPFGIAVIGLYATDIHHARQAGLKIDPRWMYAVVVGMLSAVTAMVFMLPYFLKKFWGFGWDGVLFILWSAVFGIFGDLFIDEARGDADGPMERMENAVWVDLANMFLWFVTFLMTKSLFLRFRPKKSPPTGRAEV